IPVAGGSSAYVVKVVQTQDYNACLPVDRIDRATATTANASPASGAAIGKQGSSHVDHYPIYGRPGVPVAASVDRQVVRIKGGEGSGGSAAHNEHIPVIGAGRAVLRSHTLPRQRLQPQGVVIGGYVVLEGAFLPYGQRQDRVAHTMSSETAGPA